MRSSFNLLFISFKPLTLTLYDIPGSFGLNLTQDMKGLMNVFITDVMWNFKRKGRGEREKSDCEMKKKTKQKQKQRGEKKRKNNKDRRQMRDRVFLSSMLMKH